MRGRKSPLFLTVMDKGLILKLAQERIDALDRGLFVVDLTVSATNVINVELDCEKGGVSIEDCISVSRNIEHNLDREKEDFELNVSSAGMDKPLRHEKQFIKHTGKKISLLKKTGEVVEGVLIAFNDDCWVVDCEKKIKTPKKKAEVITERIEYLKTEIKEIKRVISFK